MTSLVSIAIFVAMAVVVHSTPFDLDSKPYSCPENEEYYKCSQIHCYKNCNHLTMPPACPSVTPDCYNPACECVQDYLRNEDGICVPFQKCRNWQGQGK